MAPIHLIEKLITRDTKINPLWNVEVEKADSNIQFLPHVAGKGTKYSDMTNLNLDRKYFLLV